MTRSFSVCLTVLAESERRVSPCTTYLVKKVETEWGVDKAAIGLVYQWFCIPAAKHLLCPFGPLMSWRAWLEMHRGMT